MTTLVVGAVPKPEHFALFWTNSNRVLESPFKVEARVLDFSASIDSPVQLWPDTDGARVDITTIGKVADGVYAPFDTDEENWWTPTESYSSAVVEYRITPAEGEAEVIRERPFDAYPRSVFPAPFHGAITVADLRSAGLSESTYTDAACAKVARHWTAVVERYLGRNVALRYDSRRLNFQGDDIAYPDDFISAVGRVRFVGDDEDADLTTLSVSFNPNSSASKILIDNGRVGRYAEARRWDWNLERYGAVPADVTGCWGLVDLETGTVLPGLAEAIANVAAKDVMGEQFSMGPVRRERVDAHEIEYAVNPTTTSTRMTSLLKDPALHELLSLYKKPMSVRYLGAL